MKLLLCGLVLLFVIAVSGERLVPVAVDRIGVALVTGEPSPGPGFVQIYYYQTTWDKSYLHYNNGTGWTPVPGVQMEVSSDKQFPSPSYHQLVVPANALTFVFNDGNGHWDHGPSGGNFQVASPGIFEVKVDVVTTIKTFPGVCPSKCSDHGTCNTTDYTCVCDKGYYGVDCSSFCDLTKNVICCAGQVCECVQGTVCPVEPLPGCEIFSDTSCIGDQTDMFPDFVNRDWQTPRKGDAHYFPSFNDYGSLKGHAHVVYDTDRKSAVVNLNVLSNSPGASILYYFDGKESSESSAKFSSSFGDSLQIGAKDDAGHVLKLDPVDFFWNTHTPLNQSTGDYRKGQKGSIVEMFGWPDEDVAQECENIGKAGYLGVKLFPHQEQLMSTQPFENMLNPWYFMYQPVSYRLEGRMGTREQLRKTIATCRSHGVRVYADAVVNHMTGSGNDAWPSHRADSGSCTYWPAKNSSAPDPSPFYTNGFCYEYDQYSKQPCGLEFPAVPWGPMDFHCERPLNSWTDPLELNAGWLTGLVDLNTDKDSVQERIADYMTDLIGIGFSGLRVDAAKHMKPDDLVGIFSKLRRNLGGSLPDDFITYWEILTGGEADMLLCDDGSGYNYGQYLSDAFTKAGFPQSDLDKIKIWASYFPKEPEADCGKVPKVRTTVENDDADQQNDGSSSRDMGNFGSVLVKDRDVEKHRGFEVQLFENPQGVQDNDNDYPIRLILSSYYFDSAVNKNHAIPDGKSDCKLCTLNCDTCETVPYTKAYQKDACSYDGPVYTRVHRDAQIITAMRSWMHLTNEVSHAEIGVPKEC